MIPIVVLASGRGSNFEAVQVAIENQKLQAKICAVISDQPSASVLGLARTHGVRSVSIPFPEQGDSLEGRRREHETLLLKELDRIKPRFLVLAGYRRVMTSQLIEAFRSPHGYSRIVNIHPSLLPSFPGLNSYGQSYRFGAKVAGVTVHLVEEQVDSGPICAQESFSIGDCDSEAEVEKRGLAVEHELFPKVLSWILPEKFTVLRRLLPSSASPSETKTAGRLCVCPN